MFILCTAVLWNIHGISGWFTTREGTITQHDRTVSVYIINMYSDANKSRTLVFLTTVCEINTNELYENVMLFAHQVHVSDTENSEEASFFESYEAAHSSHSLSGSIAKVPLSMIFSHLVLAKKKVYQCVHVY